MIQRHPPLIKSSSYTTSRARNSTTTTTTTAMILLITISFSLFLFLTPALALPPPLLPPYRSNSQFEFKTNNDNYTDTFQQSASLKDHVELLSVTHVVQETDTHEIYRRPSTGTHGGVATEHEICSKIGTRILKDGGSAVDAAIGGLICVGTLNAFHSGIGGGGFMLLRTNDGSYEAIDFREMAPSLANKTMFVKNPKLARVGGLSVGVPGELKAFEYAHKKYGALPWARLFTDTITLAMKGFPCSRKLVVALEENKDYILSDPEFRSIYAPNGTICQPGEWITMPKYGRTLELIAKNGASVFYDANGPIAPNVVKTIQERNGAMTLEDWSSYSLQFRDPIIGSFLGKKVVTMGAPASGNVLMELLNIVETMVHDGDVESIVKYVLDNAEEGTVRREDDVEEVIKGLHRLVETMKFGYAFRTELGDPGFMEASQRRRIMNMTTKRFAREVRKNVTDTRTHPVNYYNPKFDTIETPGTTHTSVLDETGMAVSVTSTVNLWFGSKVICPRTGILLNNEMDDFSIPGVPNAFGLYPSPYNFPQPHKRPLSSSVPTIVENDYGFVELVIGASGGSKIISGVFLTILQLYLPEVLPSRLQLSLSLPLPLKTKNIMDAIRAPRFHHQLLPDRVEIEEEFAQGRKDWIEGLRERGHEILKRPHFMFGNAVYSVYKRNGIVSAASDPRNYGVADAY